MNLKDNLMVSRKEKGKKRLKASFVSVIAHSILVGAIIFISASASHRVDAEDRKIPAFLESGAAPPPPPPPPPPAASKGAPKSTPKVVPQVQPRTDVLIPPREIPKDVPKIQTPITSLKTPEPATDDSAAVDTGAVEGGVTGGVPGGVVGGVQGGTVGGEVGGVLGGEIGGVQGGVVGGTVGGQGTGTEGTGTGAAPAPPPPPPPPEVPDGPLRVGGDVKAPAITARSEPRYTEPARAARVEGVVVVEAIISKDGRVEQVRVIKDLPMGLGDEAIAAVKKWRFKPATLNGQPVEVIFNLTVNFKLQ